MFKNQSGSAAVSYATMLFLCCAVILVALCVLGPCLTQKRTDDSMPGGATTTTGKAVEDAKAWEKEANAKVAAVCEDGCVAVFGPGSALENEEYCEACVSECWAGTD